MGKPNNSAKQEHGRELTTSRWSGRTPEVMHLKGVHEQLCLMRTHKPPAPVQETS